MRVLQDSPEEFSQHLGEEMTSGLLAVRSLLRLGTPSSVHRQSWGEADYFKAFRSTCPHNDSHNTLLYPPFFFKESSYIPLKGLGILPKL